MVVQKKGEILEKEKCATKIKIEEMGEMGEWGNGGAKKRRNTLIN